MQKDDFRVYSQILSTMEHIENNTSYQWAVFPNQQDGRQSNGRFVSTLSFILGKMEGIINAYLEG